LLNLGISTKKLRTSHIAHPNRLLQESTIQRRNWTCQCLEIENPECDSFDVRLADNGPGIPVAIRESLFDPFVSSGKLNGTGLGLAIVLKIIHDHGGSVSVEKTSDAGTVFFDQITTSC
jgi:nitrogen-specific signal transduction histidine kinase